MENPVILILADAFDTHADAVSAKIVALGGSVFRLNLDVDALKQTHISFSEREWIIQIGGKSCKSGNIRAVWPRRLTVSQTLQQQHEDSTAGMRLWKGEWNRTLYSLYFSLRKLFWLNPIQAAALADNKTNQAFSATRIGLNVPNTIISNNKKDLLEFSRDNEAVALKFMSQDMYKGGDGKFSGLYVNRITSADIEQFGSSEENPVTLQAYIDKSFEVRYTVVGTRHFVCAIDSQKSKRAATDWRRYDIPNTPHRPIEPPDKIRLQVTELMEAFGLSFGALDFIVDLVGNWWFLEVNTAGQWLWIEDLSGLAISDEVSRLLVAEAKRGDE